MRTDRDVAGGAVIAPRQNGAGLPGESSSGALLPATDGTDHPFNPAHKIAVEPPACGVEFGSILIHTRRQFNRDKGHRRYLEMYPRLITALLLFDSL